MSALVVTINEVVVVKSVMKTVDIMNCYLFMKYDVFRQNAEFFFGIESIIFNLSLSNY